MSSKFIFVDFLGIYNYQIFFLLLYYQMTHTNNEQEDLLTGGAEGVANVVEGGVIDAAGAVNSAVQGVKKVNFLVDVESKAIVESLGGLDDFSISSIPKVLPKLIQHVENYKNLTGSQKREIIIKMIKHIIDITDGPGNDAIWDPILKELVPGLIDTLLEVNDKKLKLRKKPKSWLRVLCCKPKLEN
jgi:hypothetical protein